MNLIPKELLDKVEGTVEDLVGIPAAGIPVNGTIGANAHAQQANGLKSPDEKGFIAGSRCLIHRDASTKLVRVWFFGPFHSMNDYRNLITLLYTLTSDYRVNVYIHSPGGSITVACLILSALEKCKAEIYTYNIGSAASCGSLILSFGKKIHIDPLAITMFHNSAGGGSDSTHRLLSRAQHTSNMVSRLFGLMRDRGLLTQDEIDGIVKSGKEYYINSDEMTRRLKENNLWLEEGES